MRIEKYNSYNDAKPYIEKYLENKPPVLGFRTCDYDLLNEYYSKWLKWKTEFYIGYEDDNIVGFLAFGIYSEDNKDIYYLFQTDLPICLLTIDDPFKITFLENLNINWFSQSLYYKELSSYHANLYYKYPANIINLTGYENLNDYFESLSKDHRSQNKRTLNKNSDLIIDSTFNITKQEVDDLFIKYLYYWAAKDSHAIKKVLLDKKVIESLITSEVHNVVLIQIKKEDKLIALNIAITYEDTIIDVMCLRDPYYDNLHLGNLAILRNIEKAIESNYKFYDLQTSLDFEMTYFKKFLNNYNITIPCIALTNTSENMFPPYYHNGEKKWIL